MRRRKFSLKLKAGAVLILAVALFVFLDFSGFSKPVKNFFYSATAPLQEKLWKSGSETADFFGAFFEMKSLKKENNKLNLKIQELVARNVLLEELKEENIFLREALNLELRKDFRLVEVAVFSKDISQDFILINKGTKDNITKGMPVITAQRSLCGKINEVYGNFSQVMLISHKESEINAKIFNKKIEGVAKGKGGLAFYLDLIQKDKEVTEGDSVVTSILGGGFPENLLLGTVKSVETRDAELFTKAEVTPCFNINELDNLFVITEF